MSKDKYTVVVKKGADTESINVMALDADDAQRVAIETFYFDGWHAISASLVEDK